MSAYLIVDTDVSDPVQYESYKQQAPSLDVQAAERFVDALEQHALRSSVTEVGGQPVLRPDRGEPPVAGVSRTSSGAQRFGWASKNAQAAG